MSITTKIAFLEVAKWLTLIERHHMLALTREHVVTLFKYIGKS